MSEAGGNNTRIRLVAGLGNPGREYDGTRHNVGFLVIDELAQRCGVGLAFSNSWQALWGKTSDGCFLVKPQTFMNHSGRAVKAVGSYYKIAPAETVVIYDELALPLGKLRLRREGSAGGHNGMQSVIEHLGTNEAPRLRVGIGSARGEAMVGYVLGKFASDERDAVDAAVKRAADAVECARRDGFETAMNRFNRAPSPAPQEQ